jgi:DNA-binding transcriptional MerR regulator
MAENEQIGQKELEKLTGLDRRYVQYYTDQGILIPEYEVGGKGTGTPRRYGANNVEEAKLLNALKVYGVQLSAVRAIMNAWREKREALTAKQKKAEHLFMVVGKPEEDKVHLDLVPVGKGDDCIVSAFRMTEVESAIIVKIF